MTPSQIRELILRESYRAHVGHIGSCLSIADMVAVLFNDVLHNPGTDDPRRDRFILSKGHAVLALYAAMHLKGLLTREELETYCADGSLLGSHPDHRLRGIEFSTGSLGMGLSLAAGLALASRMRSSPARSFVLMSDAELNEGSVWETVMFASHHHLSNLVALIDCNGQQAMGRTDAIVNTEPLVDKWRAFGWTPREVDGHDADALHSALTASPEQQRPTAIIARTVFGKGVSFMERDLQWHYYPIDEAKLAQALEGLQLSTET